MKIKVLLAFLFLAVSGICTAQELSPEQKEEKEFLAANRSVKGVKTLGSGLQYKIINPGKGRRPVPGDEIYVKYIGRFADGTIFDQSTAKPAVFRMNGVIPGMSEGLGLIKTGGKIILYIPSKLGYGSEGSGAAIPPNKLLIFEVELLDIYNEKTD